ncbi:MAG: hypothetical protein LBO07_05525 [Coriobacteriales bacterium]|jgi:RNA polymerase sigma-70 factor (ECF subfamily)|nr:hypothetical protein [Coriobacteriales bacterium]
MKVEYTYRFANGDTAVINIEADEFALLSELDRIERNGQRRETRRHTSLDALDEGRTPCAPGNDPAAIYEAREALEALIKALGALSPEQRRLVRSLFVDGTAPSHIARNEGVSTSAISHRTDLLLKRLRKLLE